MHRNEVFVSSGGQNDDQQALFYSKDTEPDSENEIQVGSETVLLTLKYADIERAIQRGDSARAGELLDEAFSAIGQSKPVPEIAKTYCLGLYVCLMRCCDEDKVNTYIQGIAFIRNAVSFFRIEEFIRSRAMEIVYQRAPANMNKYSSLVKGTLRIIDENIANEALSLRWIARENLFTNVDYLGKIFKRETGINFSQYVMQKRMEVAKKQLAAGKIDKIYELAAQVGYGVNAQYFSQVFKRYTGFSPLEYREMAKMSFQNS